MGETSQRRDRPGDPYWAKQPTVTCWLCQTPNPSGTAQVGGARVPVCEVGQGCKDGRIFHGPPASTVHYPGEDCPICGPASPAARRIAGNTAKAAIPRRNASPRHR